jgi:hypothetical protein
VANAPVDRPPTSKAAKWRTREQVRGTGKSADDRGVAANRPRTWLTVSTLIPFAIYLLHATMFGDWINDDAGISFSYARSLAAGHGLVSQPGVAPVEGYSNFLWVLLLAPLFLFNAFDPILTPKIVSALLILFAFLSIQLSLSRPSSFAATTASLSFIGINTSFVVWTMSGLENALYVFVLTALLLVCSRVLTTTRGNTRYALLAGLLSASAALTRPDGILFVVCYPVVRIIQRSRSATPARGARRNLLAYVATVGGILGSVSAFRYLYFGDLLPNTHLAKGGPTLKELIALIKLDPDYVHKLMALMGSIAGRFDDALIVLVMIGTCYLVFRRKLESSHVVLGLFLTVSLLCYLLLPTDWMPEYRFATPVFLFFFPFVTILARSCIARLDLAPAARSGLAFVLALGFAFGLVHVSHGRSERFSRNPTVPFSEVAQRFGVRFNDYARRLAIENGSILLPDIGGTLFVSELRIYDLAGLCDRSIARFLGHGREGYSYDHAGFYEYVFEQAQPTFIHTHTKWTLVARLGADSRFRRDYVALQEYVDAKIQEDLGETVYSGDFVRKDAIHSGNLESLREIQAELSSESDQ